MSRIRVLVGKVTNGDKLAVLGEAMALPNPFRCPEPFGLAMTEALACGTPVLTCPIGRLDPAADVGAAR